MNSIRLTLSLIFLCLSFLPNAVGSEDFLVLLRGESVNSAYQLHQILSGPGVETSGFVQSESYDMDQLMLIRTDCYYPGC